MILQIFLSILAFYLSCINSQSQTNPWPNNDRYNVDRFRITMGSCVYQKTPNQPLWQYIPSLQPDVWLFLGDNVYLDQYPCSSCDVDGNLGCFNECWNNLKWYEHPIDQYNNLLNHSQFNLNRYLSNFTNWPPTALLIWDDHDYGLDNADATFDDKNITKEGFMYFWEQVDINNEFKDIRTKIADDEDRGIYYSHEMTKTFESGEEISIRFYLLDVRWYRNDTSILGDEQQKWFENLIYNDSVDFHVILTGSVVFLDFSVFDKFSPEVWSDNERQQLLDLLDNANISDRTILLSGDVHFSAVSHRNKTFEITSSSMTHSLPDSIGSLIQNENIPGLITDVINKNNIGVLDLGLDGFELTFLDTKGNDMIFFSFNYQTQTVVYEVYDKSIPPTFVDSALFWVIISISVICCCCIGVTTLLGILYYKKKKSADLQSYISSN